MKVKFYKFKSKLYKLASYIKRIAPYIYMFLPLYLKFLVKTKSGSEEDIWLISERGDEARDNGYHLFEFIRINYPDIPVYFVLDKESSDYSKVSKYRNLIQPNSKEHFEMFIQAKKLISTHMYGAAPYGKACLPFLRFMEKKHHINIRHGITFSKFKVKDKNIDLFICSSELEKECYRESSQNVLEAIKVLGLCRYDKLIDESKENHSIILVMPTFRKWLEDLSRVPNYKEIFMNDDYFTKWKGLLENKQLHRILEKGNIQLIFYPHYRSQKFIDKYQVDNNRVILAKKEDYDIQSLLKKSSLLITDYSSVHFDFAYMKKPVLYYQFDKKKFNKDHYQFKYSYDEAGLGPICKTEGEVIDKINSIVNNNFLMGEKYQKRLKNTFKYQDQNNTKRNFEEIKKLK